MKCVRRSALLLFLTLTFAGCIEPVSDYLLMEPFEDEILDVIEMNDGTLLISARIEVIRLNNTQAFIGLLDEDLSPQGRAHQITAEIKNPGIFWGLRPFIQLDTILLLEDGGAAASGNFRIDDSCTTFLIKLDLENQIQVRKIVSSSQQISHRIEIPCLTALTELADQSLLFAWFGEIAILGPDGEPVDLVHSHYVPTDLSPLEDGGYYYSRFFGPQFLDEGNTVIGRFDSGHSAIWERVFDTDISTQDLGIAYDSFLVYERNVDTELASSGDILFLSNRRTPERNDEVYVVRLNPDGETIWEWVSDNLLDRVSASLVESFDGHIFVLHRTVRHSGLLTHLTKLTANGEFVWEKTYEPLGFERSKPRKIIQTRDGNLLIVGSVTFPNPDSPEEDGRDMLLFKVDTDGNFVTGTTLGHEAWQSDVIVFLEDEFRALEE